MIHIKDVSPVKSRTTLTIGGQSFTGRVMRVAVSADGSRLYAGTASGVWRSDDGGLNWRQMNWPQPPPGTTVVPGALPSPNIHAIWVSPANANIVLAGVGHDGRVPSRNGIYRSLDGGTFWTLVHQFPPASRLCTEIFSPPDDPNTIYAAGETAIAVSTDGGASFVDRLPWGPLGGAAWHVTAAPIDGTVRRVFAVGGGVMWVSLDGGATWTRDQGNVPGGFGGPPDGRGSGGNPGEFAATNGAPIAVVNPDHKDRIYVAGNGRGVWSVDYSNFAATKQGVWTPLPLPTDNVGSGRFYIFVKSIAAGQHLLFHSDSVTVRVCAAPPTDASSWHSIDPNHQNHVDPHCLAISPNFSAQVVPSGIVPVSGSLWASHDGGVSRTDNAGQQWNGGAGLSVLAPLNITAAAAGGQTALCVGTGDNNGFYSSDAGVNWKSQDYIGGDNDCCFVDPKLPSRLLVFAPRNGPDRPLRFYASGGGVPDGTTGTSQVKVIPGPTPFPLINNVREDAWTSVSFYVFRGYRPLILTRTGEATIPDLDFVTIRTMPDQTRVVLRTTKMTTITQSTDWDTTATADGPGVKVFQQGPTLPTNNVSIVQASGGHASPTIYVRDAGAGRLWKWTAGMTAWQEITYTGPKGAMFAAAFFVDPYRPATLYIVDSTNGAIYRSDNAGASAVRDDALTAAVTENGTFKIPLDDSFYDTEGIVNDILFDPDDPARRFVVAYTGAYFTVDGVTWSRMMSTTALPQHTQMAALDTVSDACNHALYIATGGRGMLRLKPLPVAMKVTDVSRITGRRIVGPLTSWQTPNGPFTVEHLAGRDANGHLIVFWWSPPHDWQAIDVTAITGRTIAGPLTSWQTPNGPYLVEHLAAHDANGHLIVFWWSPQHDWQAVDISAITGRTVATGVTSWQTPNGPQNVEHLAACDATGRLLVFYWAPSHDWRVVDVTAISGVRVISTPTSWQTHDGTLLTEHLAAQSPTGELIEFSWSPAHDWQAVNVTAVTGFRIGGAPTSWLTPNGPLTVTHLAAAGADGRLRVFFMSAGHNWQAVDVTARTGVSVATGDVSSWQVNKCRPVNFEHLAATDATGRFQIFTWSPENDWYATDVTALTGLSVNAGATIWQTPNGPYNVEHLAAPTPAGELIVFFTRASEVLTGRSDLLAP